MNYSQRTFCLALCGLIFAGTTEISQAKDRVGGDFARADSNGDGKLNQDEWRRRGNFARLDTDKDGYLNLQEVRAIYQGHSERSYDWPPGGFRQSQSIRDPDIESDLIDSDDLERETKCAIGRSRRCSPEASIKRGLFETGLGPVFPEDSVCPGIDDGFALDYSFKRSREAYHGGIDLPARWGTPMIAAAAGTVVGLFRGERSARGIEIVLRHSPTDTGLDFWVYTGYGHLDRMPDLEIGQRVRRGEIIGPTGNSGVSGKGRKQVSLRRPAIHFSTFFSDTAKYAIRRDIVIPVNGQWLDPIALYRGKIPFDSDTLKNLPDSQKDIPVSVLFEDRKSSDISARFVWPYMCKRR